MAIPQITDDWEPDIVIYADASVSSEGVTSIGYVLETLSGDTIDEKSQELDEEKPIQVAEYIAVLRAVSDAKSHGYTNPLIYTDYQVVVKHVFGESSPDDEICHRIKDKLVSLLKDGFNRWMLEWIPREENEKAHKQASVAKTAAV